MRGALVLLALLAAGCEELTQVVAPDRPATPSWNGPLPPLVVHVTGPAASADPPKREVCRRVAENMGARWDLQAPVQAVLHIGSDQNRLSILSLRRGLLLDQSRPGWGMDELCKDAIALILREFSAEPAARAKAAPRPLQPLEPYPAVAATAPPVALLAPRPAPAPSAELPLFPAPAGANPKVKELVAAAIQRASTGANEEALDLFLEAKRLSGHTFLLANLGELHRRLHHDAEAIRFLSDYLNRDLDPPNREAVERTLAALRARVR